MTFPLPGANWTYLHGLRLVATTGVSGYTLVNGTGTVLSWTAPSDGKMHRCMIFACLDVTSAQTGGQVSISYSLPDGSAGAPVMFAGGHAFGTTQGIIGFAVEPGSTVTFAQSSALTAGAAIVWAEIWAS